MGKIKTMFDSNITITLFDWGSLWFDTYPI